MVALRLPTAQQKTVFFLAFSRRVNLKRCRPRELIRAERMTWKSENGSLQPKRKQSPNCSWSFSCVLLFFSFLQIKSNRKNEGSVGLYTYPVLQAADILLYK